MGKDSFDAQAKITEALEGLVATGLRSAKMPSLVFSVLQNLVKGRLKINMELSGYENMLTSLNATVQKIILAVFSCVLFSGSCRLCTTDIYPSVDGIPLVALIGFVMSVSLAIYTVRSLIRKK